MSMQDIHDAKFTNGANMIEQLLTNRSSIPYAIACFCIVLSVFIGYLFGYQEPSAVCAEYIIQERASTSKAIELNEALTQCKATKAGEAVIDCKRVCDEQTKKALNNYRSIVCED